MPAQENHSGFRVLRAAQTDTTLRLQIEFPHQDGTLHRLWMSRGTLTKTNEAKAIFADAGASWPENWRVILDELMTANPPITRLTSVGGWHGSTLVTTAGACRGHQDTSKIDFDPEHLAYKKRSSKGDVKSFLQGIGPYLEASDYLILAFLAGLAPALMSRAGQREGFSIIYCGSSSTGKTLSLRLCQAISSRADVDADLQGFGDTQGSVVKNLPAFNGQAVAFSDIKESFSKKEIVEKLRPLTFRAQRHRLTDTCRAPNPGLSVLLFSAEQQLADLFASAGEEVQGGEYVRLISVPVPSVENSGIFSGADRSSGELVAGLNEVLRRQHGTLLPAWVCALTKAPPLIVSASFLLGKVLFKKSPELLGHHARIADTFSSLAATAFVAHLYEMLPISIDRVLACLQRLFHISCASMLDRDSRSRTARNDLIAMLDMLPRATIGRQIQARGGFTRQEENGEYAYVLPSTLRDKLGDEALKELLPLLQTSGALQRNGAGWTWLVQQSGVTPNRSSRSRYYKFDLKKLAPFRRS